MIETDPAMRYEPTIGQPSSLLFRLRKEDPRR